MWYHISLPVPAGTTEAAPVKKEIKLTHGVITYLGVGFPPGCKQLVKCRIYDQEHQIFPNNPDEPASWSGGIEGGQEHYKLDDQPYTVVARAYSPSAVSAHTLTILINVLPVEVAEPWTEQTSILDKLKSLFGLG